MDSLHRILKKFEEHKLFKSTTSRSVPAFLTAYTVPYAPLPISFVNTYSPAVSICANIAKFYTYIKQRWNVKRRIKFEKTFVPRKFTVCSTTERQAHMVVRGDLIVLLSNWRQIVSQRGGGCWLSLP